MGLIYKISNTVNDKVYIGQTTRSLQDRWYEHLKASEKKNNLIYKAMRKYGKENFFISLLEECPDDKLNEREVYWIEKENSCRNGYNLTIGGDGVSLSDYSHKYIPIAQYDRIGNKVAEYESALEAEQKTGIPRSLICHVCKGTRQSAGGYQWKYKQDGQEKVDPIYTPVRTAPNYEVVQFSLSGEKIVEYKSVREASRMVGHAGNNSSIRKCASGKLKTAFGYQWKYKSEVGSSTSIQPTKYSGKGGRPKKF